MGMGHPWEHEQLVAASSNLMALLLLVGSVITNFQWGLGPHASVPHYPVLGCWPDWSCAGNHSGYEVLNVMTWELPSTPPQTSLHYCFSPDTGATSWQPTTCKVRITSSQKPNLRDAFSYDQDLPCRLVRLWFSVSRWTQALGKPGCFIPG